MSEKRDFLFNLKISVSLITAFFLGFIIAWFTSTVNKSVTNEINTPSRAKFLANIQNNVQPKQIKAYMKQFASEPHMAGTEAEKRNAEKIYEIWTDLGYETKILPYKVLLSFPVGDMNSNNFVSWIDENGKTVRNERLEKKLGHKTDYDYDKIVQPFNGFSGNGQVTGHLIYVNYGRTEDFELLKNKFNINFQNYIAVAKYGKIFRGNKATNAEYWNCSGLILFTAPNDYAPKSVGKEFPDGVLMPSSGVQRGSLKVVGDGLTMGYPAFNNTYRPPINSIDLPKIPTLPISYSDALRLLKAEKSVENYMKELPSEWDSGLGIEKSNSGRFYQYENGDTFKKKVTLNVNVTKELRTVYNVHAILRGTIEPDRYVILGNHRDAWVYGAIDPTSGTVTMLETSRVLSESYHKDGWRPRRSIIFCSWAAEEQGLIGSVEWVETFGHILWDRTVAYLNTDIAVQGTHTFRGRSSSALINDLFYTVAKRVINPNETERQNGRETVFDSWTKYYATSSKPNVPRIHSLGSGSDFHAFINQIGITCADLRYTFDPKLPLSSYPLYHTMYETIELVEKYDPDYIYHKAVTQIWIELTLELSDSVIIPFNVLRFGEQLTDYVGNFIKKIRHDNVEIPKNIEIALSELKSISQQFKNEAKSFLNDVNNFKAIDGSSLLIRSINDRLMAIERHFINVLGLPKRTITERNLLLSPSYYNSYGATAFPGLNDALYEINKKTGSWDELHKQLSLLTASIYQVNSSLKIQFF